MAHPIVHARDVQLFIEDSGPYILALGACFLRLFFELIPKLTSTLSPSLSFFADTECKYITKIATDICVVDLDIVCLLSPFLPSSLSLPREPPRTHLVLLSFEQNFVNIPAPALGVLSTNQTRDKIKSRLVKAFGDGKGFFTEHTVPAEFMVRPSFSSRTLVEGSD